MSAFADAVPALSRTPLLKTLRRLLIAGFIAFMVLQGLRMWTTAVVTKAGQVSEPARATNFEDYYTFYTAGRMLLEGEGGRLYDVEAVRRAEHEVLGRPIDAPEDAGVLPYFNPPFFAAAMAPLAALPVGLSSGVAFALVCLLIGSGGLLVVRFLGLTLTAERALVAAWFLCWPSTVLVAIQGQLSMLPLLAWLGFVWLQLRGRPGWAGAALALALVKPQFVVLALPVLVWKRDWRTLRSFTAIAGVLVAVSILVAGPGVLIEYPRLIIASAAWDREYGIVPESMFGWSGFLQRSLGLEGSAQKLAAAVLVLASLAVTLLCLRGTRPASSSFVAGAGALLAASMLISLHLYRQDLALLTLLIAFGAWHQRRVRGNWGPWPAVAAFAWLVQYVELNYLYGAGVNAQTPVLAAVLLLLAWSARRDAAAAHERRDAAQPAPARIGAPG
jgi:hypothetical protein